MGAHADIYAAISPIVPTTHVAWPVGHTPELPWAIYMVNGDPEMADNTNYYETSRCAVELYMRNRDASIVGAIGEAIAANFGPYTSNEYWVESERCLMVTFHFIHYPRNGGQDNG